MRNRSSILLVVVVSLFVSPTALGIPTVCTWLLTHLGYGRQLPVAHGPSDGSNLIVSHEFLQTEPGFAAGMGTEVNRVATMLTAHRVSGTVTVDLIQRTLEEVGLARRRIAEAHGIRDASAFGRAATDTSVDLLGANPYAARLVARARASEGGRATFAFEGVTYDLSTISGWQRLSAVHPPPGAAQTLQLRRIAYRSLVEALSQPDLTETQVLERVARAHYLLIHVPPFQRGTSASVHALCDAVVRARLGRALPRLRPGVDPAMEALTRLPEDFIRNYRYFFEP